MTARLNASEFLLKRKSIGRSNNSGKADVVRCGKLLQHERFSTVLCKTSRASTSCSAVVKNLAVPSWVESCSRQGDYTSSGWTVGTEVVSNFPGGRCRDWHFFPDQRQKFATPERQNSGARVRSGFCVHK